MTRNPEKQEIRERIRNRRKELDLTLQQVADRTGLTVQKVNNIESGEREIKASEIVPFSTALGCSPSYLLTGREETSRSAIQETGLFQTSINQLQHLQQTYNAGQWKYFDRIREVIDVLTKYPGFLLDLYSYFVEDQKYIYFTDPETNTPKVIDVTAGQPEGRNPDYPRLKYLPFEYQRMRLYDWLSIIRRKEHEQRQETAETARSAPSGSQDEQKPV